MRVPYVHYIIEAEVLAYSLLENYTTKKDKLLLDANEIEKNE